LLVYRKRASKRGEAPLFNIFPLSFPRRGGQGVRLTRLTLSRLRLSENEVALPLGRSLREIGAEMSAAALLPQESGLSHQATG